MTTAQVVETSVTVIQDYVHPDDQTQPFEMTPWFKPFTIKPTIEILDPSSTDEKPESIRTWNPRRGIQKTTLSWILA